MNGKTLLIAVALSAVCLASVVGASGVFEVNLASLVASTGRDLRDDCCNWLQQRQAAAAAAGASSPLDSPLDSQQADAVGYPQQASHLQTHQTHQRQQHCDQDKCQLYVRICVKYYQTTIDPSQCTFGELNAQVLRQHLNLHAQHQHQHQHQHLASLQQQQQQAKPINKHYERMLQQQQLSASSGNNNNNNKLLAASQHSNNKFAYNSMQQHQQHQQLQAASNGGKQRAMRTINFKQPIQFPFNFTWPGSFSLIIEAWYEVNDQPQKLVQTRGSAGNLADNPYLSSFINNNNQADIDSSQQQSAIAHLQHVYRRQNIIRHSMNGWLSVKNEWTNGVHQTDRATLTYAYRVMCQTNYYGEQCAILCRPRDDAYGHYRCSNGGEIVCLPGWHGNYCSEPTCLPGCHRVQGNCSRPNECTCRYGWQGALCDQCIRYPGCVHGSCRRPHECICEEGWGGLLCNEDLNYCTNHRPCKSGALCTNTFDENGTGSYTCTCPVGFVGKNCDKRIQSKCSNDSPCLNGGDCYELESKDLHCSCPAGFTGRYCETVQLMAENVVSSAQQTSNANTNNAFNSDFASSNSSLLTDGQNSASCMPNPCKNNGVCLASDTGFECDCPAPFKGKVCEALSEGMIGGVVATNERPFDEQQQQLHPSKTRQRPAALLEFDQNGHLQPTKVDSSKQQVLPHANLRSAAMAASGAHLATSIPPSVQAVHHLSSSQHAYSLGSMIGYGFTIGCLIIIVVLYIENLARARREDQQQRYSSYVEDVATLQNHQNAYRTSASSSASSSAGVNSAQSTIKSRVSMRTEKTMTYDELDDECGYPKQHQHQQQAANVNCMATTAMNGDAPPPPAPPPAYHYHAAPTSATIIPPAYAAACGVGAPQQPLADSLSQVYGLTNHYYHTQSHYSPHSLNYGALPQQQHRHSTLSGANRSPHKSGKHSAGTLQHQAGKAEAAARRHANTIYAPYTGAGPSAPATASRPPHYANDSAATQQRHFHELRKSYSYAANINQQQQQQQDASIYHLAQQQLQQNQQPLYQAMHAGSKANSSSRPVLVLSIMDLPFSADSESDQEQQHQNQPQLQTHQTPVSANQQQQHYLKRQKQRPAQARDSSEDDEDALC